MTGRSFSQRVMATSWIQVASTTRTSVSGCCARPGPATTAAMIITLLKTRIAPSTKDYPRASASKPGGGIAISRESQLDRLRSSVRPAVSRSMAAHRKSGNGATTVPLDGQAREHCDGSQDDDRQELRHVRLHHERLSGGESMPMRAAGAV